MRILDLFAGLGGFSSGFKRRGHEVVTVDNQTEFDTTLVANVRHLTPDDIPGPWDWIVASPPCNRFSVGTISRYWQGEISPLTQEAMDNVTHTVWLIQQLKPRWYLIENPMGMLRKLELIPYTRHYTTMCRYGAPRMKPTDFWGKTPRNFHFREPCKNGEWCHISAPRGSRAGVQIVMDYAERARLPHPFSLCLERTSSFRTPTAKR